MAKSPTTHRFLWRGVCLVATLAERYAASFGDEVALVAEAIDAAGCEPQIDQAVQCLGSDPATKCASGFSAVLA